MNKGTHFSGQQYIQTRFIILHLLGDSTVEKKIKTGRLISLLLRKQS